MSTNKKAAEKELNRIGRRSKLPYVAALFAVVGVAAFGVWYLLSGDDPDAAEPTAGKAVGLAPGGPQTPTEAYEKLYRAVKDKDKAAIRALMSKRSVALAEMQAGQSKKGVDEVLSNAFTSTTFADKLPPIRDERVKDEFGAIEVYDHSKGQWQDLPFVVEDGAWKLAVGDLFAGTYRSPGKGRSVIERENANAAGDTKMVPYGNGNVNMNVEPKIIDPMKDGKMRPPQPKRPE